MCVVLAAPGYPDGPADRRAIDGIEEVRQLQGIQLYAAGVAGVADGPADW